MFFYDTIIKLATLQLTITIIYCSNKKVMLIFWKLGQTMSSWPSLLLLTTTSTSGFFFVKIKATFFIILPLDLEKYWFVDSLSYKLYV